MIILIAYNLSYFFFFCWIIAIITSILGYAVKCLICLETISCASQFYANLKKIYYIIGAAFSFDCWQAFEDVGLDSTKHYTAYAHTHSRKFACRIDVAAVITCNIAA